jgi:class 3 adenylate cyclase
VTQPDQGAERRSASDLARRSGVPAKLVDDLVDRDIIKSGPADYFGRTVNVAARIADDARQGEVLVSQEVVDAATDAAGLRFDEIGPVDLKGLSEPVRLHVAHPA